MYFSLQQYKRFKNDACTMVAEKRAQNFQDEEIPALFQEQKSTSMFSNISVSRSTPSAEGERISWNSLGDGATRSML